MQEQIKILLTTDGKGQTAKAEVLIELAKTCNPNTLEKEIRVFLSKNSVN